MPREESEAVPESNHPVPQQEDFGSGQPTLAYLYRMIKDLFDKLERRLEKFSDDMRRMDQRLASLKQDARQPRLATEADGPADTKTRERTEGAATAVQTMHEDSFSANRVDPDPICSTSFGVKVEPSALPCRDDISVEDGAVAPNSCLSLLKMRTTTVANGLLSTGKTTTATKTTFDRPTPWFCLTEETNLGTSTQSALSDSSFFRRNNLLAAPSCQMVIETKLGQNRIFDPGGSESRLRACPFLRTWRALRCGEFMR